ncbi:hypothetical protein [Bacillus toyonensis]|uniref:hypothetical protein n=1 Tax=Bacillus toyonensis TaxID=155322 RepID=UPI002E208571|nr:hypothetical protein [Bacillus toyonensis]MED2740634.1 hypothetical protein [Bacillus toyonensis]
MLKKIEGKIRFAKKHKKYLRKLRPWNGKWGIVNKEINMLKKHIRTQLANFQDNKCAYCGLTLNETSGSEIEHIVPKGGDKQPIHPQFTFTPYNLSLSCHLCNGPVKKGKKDTIITLDINYRLCEFSIVHPYFDDPKDHFDWIPKGKKILISDRTPKGKKSIEIFKLDDTAHNEARAKLANYEDPETTDEEMELKLKRILDAKRML